MTFILEEGLQVTAGPLSNLAEYHVHRSDTPRGLGDFMGGRKEKKMKNLSNDDRAELLGQLIDIVEDYIAERKGTNEPCILGDDFH